METLNFLGKLLCSIVVFALALNGMWSCYQQTLRFNSVSDWHETRGVVVTWDVERVAEGRAGPRYYGSPSYLYNFGQKTYLGYAIALVDDRSQSSSSETLRRLKYYYPLGHEVPVYVNDENPYDTVLNRNQRPGFKTWLMLGANICVLLLLLILPFIWFPTKKGRLGALCLLVLVGSFGVSRGPRLYSTADDYTGPGGTDPVAELIERTAKSEQAWQDLSLGQVVSDPEYLAAPLFTDKMKSQLLLDGQRWDFREAADYTRQRHSQSQLVLEKVKEGWKVQQIKSPYGK